MPVRTKINLVLLIIGFLTFMVVAVLNYVEGRNRLFEEAQTKADLISSFALASRKYATTIMRPLALKMIGPDRFQPELMSGAFVTRNIANSFSESQKGFSFKQATLNPILPENKSNEQETALIHYFKKNRENTIKKGTLIQDGSEVFYVARPVVNKESCNRCHGKKEDAPQEQVEMYKGEGGYGWEVDDVVAILITYVPIKDGLSNLKQVTLKTIIGGLIAVGMIMLSTSYFMNIFVIKPIQELTEVAENISRGKGLEKSVKVKTNDEIGALSDSFNRMRVSVVKLIHMMKARK